MRAPRFPAATPPPDSTLGARVKALDEAATLAAGRSSDAAVAEAKRVCRQVDRRLTFAGDQTVVALGGATGSGKSALFNAITGTQLAKSGVRRPTTAQAMAAYWGGQAPADLLGWLDVPERHAVMGDAFPGLVLVDLPDHDSTETSHRVEVDRLVQLVDAVVWVLDPQKYADAALHRAYLAPMAAYADVMLVVLNQADRLTPDELKSALADLRRLLEQDGLGKATVLATSALTGQGIDDLRARVTQLVTAKRAAAFRLATDVTRAAKAMLGDVSRNRRRSVPDAARGRLLDALNRAAGVPQVVAAVDQTIRQRGAEATGWPAVSWVNRLKPDPLRRLRVGSTDGTVRIPGMDGSVANAQADAALREVGVEASAGLPTGWARAVSDAAEAQRADLPDAVDAALARVDLGVDAPAGWWRGVHIAQWVLIGLVGVGLVWALLGGVLPVPKVGGVGFPVLLIVGGVVLGLLLALICHAAVAASARRRAAVVGDALRRQVNAVADDLVLRPVTQELDRYADFVACVARAL